MADPRKAHVKRIHQVVTDDDGTQTMADDFWIDVMRIDQLPIRYASTVEGITAQIIIYNFLWNDDPSDPLDNIDASLADIQFENANAKRWTKQLTVRDPGVPATTGDSPKGDSVDDNSVKLWIVDRLSVDMPRQNPAGVDGQIVWLVFANNPADGSSGTWGKRTTSIIKVVNNDLDGLQMNDPDYPVDSNDTVGRPLVIDWETYMAALQRGATDPKDTLFLSVESTDRYSLVFGADASVDASDDDSLPGAKGQIALNVLTGNEAVEALFEVGDPQALNVDGNSALVRTDPFQLVVNVGSNIIAVEFAPGDTGVLTSP